MDRERARPGDQSRARDRPRPSARYQRCCGSNPSSSQSAESWKPAIDNNREDAKRLRVEGESRAIRATYLGSIKALRTRPSVDLGLGPAAFTLLSRRVTRPAVFTAR